MSIAWSPIAFSQMVEPYADAAHFFATTCKSFVNNSLLAKSPAGKSISAFAEYAATITGSPAKPRFNISDVNVNGRKVDVQLTRIGETPFANLLHFKRDLPNNNDPKVLIVPSMSGNFSTMFRGMARTMLQDHDVYILDWRDLRQVPLTAGVFSLNDYISHEMWALKTIGERVNLVAISQSGPPSAVTASLSKVPPLSLTLIGSPMDTRVNPTDVDRFATDYSTEWFQQNVISKLYGCPGHGREVYSGKLQQACMFAVGMDRHLMAQADLLTNLLGFNMARADSARQRYAESFAPMDVSAPYFLDTVQKIFQEHHLPLGKFDWTDANGKEWRAEPHKMTNMGLMTVEGDRDNICSVGQTVAAHDIFAGISNHRRVQHLQPDAGHHEIFTGATFEREIYPRMRNFIYAQSGMALTPR